MRGKSEVTRLFWMFFPEIGYRRTVARFVLLGRPAPCDVDFLDLFFQKFAPG
jgi:hypothetical protein